MEDRILNSKELIEAVGKEGIIVFKNETSDLNDVDKRVVKITTGVEGYFALLA